MTFLQSRWGYVALLLVAIPVALIVLGSIGGLTEVSLLGIPVVPVYTLFGLPIDLIIRDLAMACTLGFALVGGVLSERPNAQLGKLTSLAALVWLFTLIFQSVLTVSEVLALTAGESLNLVILQSLLTQTTVGQVILAQFALVTLVAILGWVVLGRATGWIVVGLAAVAAFLPGLTGHSGMSEGHSSASIALGFHLVFMSIWVGGLVALMWYLKTAEVISRSVINYFSTIALVSVIVIAETGLLNASMRIDGIAPYLTSTYGSIIIAKATILVILIGFGWRHRQDLAAIPPQAATSGLIRLGTGELLWMGAVIGLAVALSRTAPPAFAIATDPVNLGALALVSIAFPYALVWSFPRISQSIQPRLATIYPEVVAIGLVVVIFVVSELLRVGAVGNLLGVQIAAIIFIAALIVIGLLFVAQQNQRASLPALSIFFVGWCANIYWQVTQHELIVDFGTIMITAGLFALFLYMWKTSKQHVAQDQLQPEVAVGTPHV